MLSKTELRRVLTKGQIISPGTLSANQGICATFVGSAVLDALTVPVLFKFYGDEQDTLREGKKELAARWCAKYFPYVELPAAVLRPLPRVGHWRAGCLGGVQQRIEDAKTAKFIYHDPWDNGQHAHNFDTFAAGIFDILVANQDRHQGNWLWRDTPNRAKKQRNIVLIDHGLCFYPYSDIDISCSGSYFRHWKYTPQPRPLTAGMVRGLTEIALRARTEAREWLAEDEANALAIRASLLVKEGYRSKRNYW